MHEFLEELYKYYELIIFTAGQRDYADWIIDLIDPKALISHRLYREMTFMTNNASVKDLSKIGRNLQKTIIVDNIPLNFQRQEKNGIAIESWYGNKEDK